MDSPVELHSINLIWRDAAINISSLQNKTSPLKKASVFRQNPTASVKEGMQLQPLLSVRYSWLSISDFNGGLA